MPRVYSQPFEGHITNNDTHSKPFHCKTCGKGFDRRSDLRRHDRIHSGLKPHGCDYPGCVQRFIQRTALIVHNRIHTGEKPYACKLCDKSFAESSSLRRHERVHSSERPYECPYKDCRKAFARRDKLIEHQNSHGGTEEIAATLATPQRSYQYGQYLWSYGAPPSSNDSIPLLENQPNHTAASCQYGQHLWSYGAPPSSNDSTLLLENQPNYTALDGSYRADIYDLDLFSGSESTFSFNEHESSNGFTMSTDGLQLPYLPSSASLCPTLDDAREALHTLFKFVCQGPTVIDQNDSNDIFRLIQKLGSTQAHLDPYPSNSSPWR